MKKSHYELIAGLSILFIALWGAAFFFSSGKSKKSEVLEISVVIRGRQNGYWTSIKQGIDKAAYDMNADISFVTLLEENDGEEQLAAVRRELDNEAQAVVIAPVNAEIFDEIKALGSKTVLIGLETRPLPDSRTSGIFIQNREMGYEIGKVMAGDYEEGKKLVLIRTLPTAACIAEREDGFLEALQEHSIPVEYWNIQSNEAGSVEQIKSKIVLDGADLLAALSADDIVSASHAVSSVFECDIPVYGVGSTNEIFSYMEKGIVHTVVAYSGFNLGYLGVKSAVDAIKRKSPKNEIILDYVVVNLENLYTDSNQKLLFPVVK